MKKIITLLLIVSCLVSSTMGSVSAQEEEPITIVWAGGQTDAEVNMDSDLIKAVEERYNCKFDIWFMDSNNWDDEMNVRLAAGEVPDVIRLLTKTNLPSYVQQGLIGEVPIELIQEKAPSYMAMLEKYDTANQAFLYTTYNGTNYGFAFPTARNSYPEGIMWRLDWLRNVGIDKIPTTLEEFETAMYKFTFEDPDQNGKDDTYGFSNNMLGVIFGAFGSLPVNTIQISDILWEDDGTTMSISALNDNTRQALEYLQKLYAMGVIDPEFITGENQGGYWATSDTFVNGRIGVTGKFMYDHWSPADPEKGTKGGTVFQAFTEANPDLVYGEDFDFGYPIVGPNGDSGTCQWPTIGEAMVFSTECVKDERKMGIILQMLEDLVSDEDYARLVCRGVEGTDWEYDEQGDFRTLTSTSADRSARGINVLNFSSTPANFDEEWNKDFYEEICEKYSSTYYPNLYVPATDEVARYKVGLNTITSEYFTKIITGEYSIDKFEEYVEEMNANGAQEVMDSVNEVYKTLR